MQCEIQNLMNKCEKITAERLENVITTLPEEMREGVRMCHQFSLTRNKKGMRYSQRWILECLLLRIKSRKAYLHILNHNLLPLPSISTLNRYLQNLKPTYGFDPQVFRMLKKRSEKMSPEERRGSTNCSSLSM